MIDVDEARHGVTTETVRLHRWTYAWWGAWILSVIAGVVVNSMNKNTETLDAALSASNAFMVRSVILMIAAVLAACAVHFVTRQQRALPRAR